MSSPLTFPTFLVDLSADVIRIILSDSSCGNTRRTCKTMRDLIDLVHAPFRLTWPSLQAPVPLDDVRSLASLMPHIWSVVDACPTLQRHVDDLSMLTSITQLSFHPHADITHLSLSPLSSLSRLSNLELSLSTPADESSTSRNGEVGDMIHTLRGLRELSNFEAFSTVHLHNLVQLTNLTVLIFTPNVCIPPTLSLSPLSLLTGLVCLALPPLDNGERDRCDIDDVLRSLVSLTYLDNYDVCYARSVDVLSCLTRLTELTFSWRVMPDDLDALPSLACLSSLVDLRVLSLPMPRRGRGRCDIDDVLRSLVSLTYLDNYDVCYARSVDVLSCLTRLTELTFSWRVVPDDLDALPSLACLSSLVDLRVLNLPKPRLGRAWDVTGVHLLPHLEELHNFVMDIPPHVLAGLAAMSGLTRLDLLTFSDTGNDVSPVYPLSCLAVLTALRELSLPYIPVDIDAWDEVNHSDVDVSWISPLTNLVSLKGCSNLGEAGARALQHCTQLTYLGLYNLSNMGWEDVPLESEISIVFPSLDILNFSDCNTFRTMWGFLRMVSLPVLTYTSSCGDMVPTKMTWDGDSVEEWNEGLAFMLEKFSSVNPLVRDHLLFDNEFPAVYPGKEEEDMVCSGEGEEAV